MTEIRIDKRKAKSLLYHALGKRPEGYVYEANGERNYGCVYTLNGEPDCMVGQALFDAGVPIEVLNDLNDRGTIDSLDVIQALEGAGVIISDGALTAFERAQRRQDMGRPWLEAYHAAKGA